MASLTKEPEITGFIHTDTQNHVACPRCRSVAGVSCKYPSGGKKWPPHTERVIVFRDKHPKVGMLGIYKFGDKESE